MKNKIIFAVFSLITIVSFAGCGKSNQVSPELIVYKNQITQFYDKVNVSNAEIKNITYTDQASIDKMLDELDKVELSFAEFAEIKVPEEFESTESLADQASEFMTEAVALYHEALEGDEIDTAKAALAESKYNNAIECVNYIGDILQGKTPVGDNLISN